MCSSNHLTHIPLQQLPMHIHHIIIFKTTQVKFCGTDRSVSERFFDVFSEEAIVFLMVAKEWRATLVVSFIGSSSSVPMRLSHLLVISIKFSTTLSILYSSIDLVIVGKRGSFGFNPFPLYFLRIDYLTSFMGMRMGMLSDFVVRLVLLRRNSIKFPLKSSFFKSTTSLKFIPLH